MRRGLDFVLRLGWTGNAIAIWLFGLLLFGSATLGVGSDRLGLYGILVLQLGGALLLADGRWWRLAAAVLLVFLVANVIAFLALDLGLLGPNVAVYYWYERSAHVMLLYGLVSGIVGGSRRLGQGPSLISGAAVGVVLFVIYIGTRQVLAVPDHVLAAPVIVRAVAPLVPRAIALIR